MVRFMKNRPSIRIIGLVVILMFFGCAGVKETKVGEKYEGSKTWVKEKWRAMGSRSSSPAEKEASTAAEHRISYFEHKVQWSGESLSLIAKWYTGQYANWKALAQANPRLNPERIHIGNIIYIPPEIMKTQKLMPYKMVAKSRPGYFVHCVRKPDEKMADIADWYTGDKSNAKLIAQANPDLDPELLLVGNEIFIPPDLLKNRKPFNEKSIQISESEPAEQPSASAALAPEKKKLELFGPKQFSTP